MVCLCKTYMHTHAHPGGSHCEHSPHTQPFWERTFTPPENTVTNISYSIPVTSISYGTLLTDRRSSLSKHRNEGKHNGDVSTTFWRTHGRRHHLRRGCSAVLQVSLTTLDTRLTCKRYFKSSTTATRFTPWTPRVAKTQTKIYGLVNSQRCRRHWRNERKP